MQKCAEYLQLVGFSTNRDHEQDEYASYCFIFMMFMFIL